MSLRSATTFDRERIRAEAQRARDAVNSKHDINKLAHEFFQRRHLEQRLANLETQRLAIAALEGKHSADNAELGANHAREMANIDNIKFTLFDEFDARREALVASSKADERLLAEEGLHHTTLVGSLVAQKTREDTEEQQQLQALILKLGKSAQTMLRWNDEMQCYEQAADLRIIQARERASASRQERQRAHDALLATHDATWKARELELRLPMRNQRRQERLELEDEFVNRVGELAQRRASVAQRHVKELEALTVEQVAARTTVMEASEAAEANMLNECTRVDEWWSDLCNEAAARLQRIDEDEQQALDEIDQQEASAATEAIRVAAAPKTALVTATVEYNGVTTSGHEPVFNSYGATRDEAAALQELATTTIPATPPTVDDRKYAGSAAGDSNGAGPPLAAPSPARMAFDADNMTTNGSYTTLTGSLALLADVQGSYPPGGLTSAEICGLPRFEAVRAAEERRSSSPDSVNSDFVEI